jgi:dihydropteroate synthase
MGIVNLTPDSFSDAAACWDRSAAIAHCERLVREGADILDLGAESTRPGATPVALHDELERLLPVLDVVLQLGCAVSIDTYKPEVMATALDRGADIVNDIYALRTPGALEAVRSHPECGVCLMHMWGTPQTMRDHPAYTDVVDEVREFLRERCTAVQAGGVAASRIVLDPGIGFAKGAAQNIELLRRQRELLGLPRPLLVGWSRKATLGAITGRDVGDRTAASVAAALAAVQLGARVVRVHDVAATVDALKVWECAGLGAG